MARQTKPLNNTEVKSAKATDRAIILYDGDGLELQVTPSGSKLWRFRYYKPFTRKRAMISLGAYPSVSLAEARKLREDARLLLGKDVDPQEHKQAEQSRQKNATENTFEKVAAEWFKTKESAGLATHTLNDIWRSMSKYVFPHIGSMPIANITAQRFIGALEPTHAAGRLETVKRLSQRINEVMDYALNSGLVSVNPAARIGRTFHKPKVKHRPALLPEQLPLLMKTLSFASIGRQTRCLIEWQLLTMTRPAEAAESRWDEIDFGAKEWRIPAGRMKMKREHIIPLSEQALGILEVMKPISKHRDYVFPGYRNPLEPMNSQTANMALKRMGFKDMLVAHGMRAIASTILNEKGFPPDVIEAALAHIDTNEVRRAYNRAQYLEQRREMMAWWGEHVESASYGKTSIISVAG
ncbi:MULTISPECIES: integrase domain-containing protein [Pectobacterium]|uniref:integrase domain-containing protein n=1 Tax=Pectobacterium TaxID=122277 RepID=UPI000502EF23|nr:MULTISPECIES: integrase domain-containing protein [Pectobacterium]KGA38923.1 integrase [Pectobacterium odoriferum]MBA0190664.1 tyrosine-type recombinase/integrase [Pectobacterium odoriferum]